VNSIEGTLLIEAHFLPLTSYYSLVKQHGVICWEAQEHFQKQTLRNRTYILTSNGELQLTVPVLHGAKAMKDVKIDYSQNWLKTHLGAITSAYKHSPYFDYYFPYFEEIYTKRYEFIFELNLEFFLLCNRILKFKKEITFTQSYQESYTNLVNIKDFRSKLEHKRSVASIHYRQVFGETFLPNLSILDLLFNMGPDSTNYL